MIAECPLSAQERYQSAVDELAAAECAAGIRQSLDALGRLSASCGKSDVYLNGLRQVVFGIGDAALRRRVIVAYRACDRLCRESVTEEIAELHKRVRGAGESIRRTHLWVAIGCGVAVVLIAGQTAGAVGAVAGAVAAVVWGVNHIRRGDRVAKANVTDALATIGARERFLRELGQRGVFSESEEITGDYGR